MFKRLFSWSRMTRECPVRFYEGPLGKFRGSTHQSRSGLSSLQMMVAALFVAMMIFGIYWFMHRPVKEVPAHDQQPQLLIALLGAPGSGKGTIAKRAEQELQFAVLSTGNLVRENIEKNTELGQQVKEYSQAGKLVPDEIIFGMVKEWLTAKAGENKTIILDGFPRTAAQAAMLTDLLKSELNQYTLRLINVDVPDEEVIRRIANRLTCENKACQATYQKSEFENQENPLCPRCGSKLIRREDDREEVVRERLAVYEQANKPLLAYYRTSNVPVENVIGAGKTPDEVFGAFKMLIKK